MRKIGLLTGAVLLILIIALTGCSGKTSETASKDTTENTETTTPKTPETTAEVKDVVIPISDVTEQAKFYPAEVDGVNMEVIAVKAPDGSIRTAFNTCQVCYSSGRGYYKAEGDTLVCQNCGNTFTADMVEVESGGCNPVPIFDENTVVDDKNITIPGELIAEAKEIFANWKTE